MTSPSPSSAASLRRCAVVIVNYRTGPMTLDCLASLEGELEPGRDVAVVVDNASGDDSVTVIESGIRDRGWSGWARVVAAAENAGFSAGNNRGMEAVAADYYLLLNSDTLVRPGAIAELLRAAEAHPEAGLIGPRILSEDGSPQHSCYHDFSPLGELLRAASWSLLSRIAPRGDVIAGLAETPVTCDWLGFPCVLLRADARRQTGPMDEGYFLYYEDADYCRRLREAGWTNLHWPTAEIVHLNGGSTGLEQLTVARERRPAYYYAARARYLARFYGRAGLWAANLLFMAGRIFSWPRELLGWKTPVACRRESLDNWFGWRRPMKTYRPGGEGP